MNKEKVELFYDKISEDYDATHDDRFVDSIFEYFLKEHIKGNSLKILDAGGGVGRFSIKYALNGHSVVLTDISQGMIDRAKIIAEKNNIPNITFFQESVTNMKNQKDKSFDVVLLMNGVLDYCNDYNKALQEVLRVLHSGGMVIGTVNNKLIYTTTNILLADKSVDYFKEAFKTGNYDKSFPIHDFDIEELTIALKKANFTIIDIVGPTNLLRKWEYNSVLTKENRAQLLELQIEFAKNKNYLNNSNDFLFIAKKL
jgi:ubiquinone/menaquinone biosynthesis C-methylase UbiE